MKIARFHRHGDPSVISHDDVDIPEPGPDEVLIKVAATSFNPTEAALRAGLLREITPVSLPYALGWDVAGTVVSTGEHVIGWLDGGAAAEYVTAPAQLLTPAPTTIPLADAATLPLAGLTAWQAVFEHAHVVEGQRVLVNGAGGGIGGFTVQLAKYAGGHVIATASPRSAARVRRQGADQVVDHTATSLAAAVREPVDTIINLVSTGPIDELIPLLRPGGVIVSAANRGIGATHFVTRRDMSQLAALTALVDTGVVGVEVSRSFPLTELARVHRHAEAGELHGKVTIVPAPLSIHEKGGGANSAAYGR